MPQRGSHRLFVAVDPPPALAAELVAWARAQRTAGTGVRVVRPENVHLTLAFLGERSVLDTAPIAGALHAAAGEWALGGGADDVPLRLGLPVLLPPRRPRVLALEVADPSGRLQELHAAVAVALRAAIGWEPEGRRFRPHLTVARLSGRDARPGALQPAPGGTFTVRSLVLYRSFLEPEGARYEALESVSLA